MGTEGIDLYICSPFYNQELRMHEYSAGEPDTDAVAWFIDSNFEKCVGLLQCARAYAAITIYSDDGGDSLCMFDQDYDVFLARDTGGRLNAFLNMPVKDDYGRFTGKQRLKDELLSCLASQVAYGTIRRVSMNIMLSDMVVLDSLNLTHMPDVQLG